MGIYIAMVCGGVYDKWKVNELQLLNSILKLSTTYDTTLLQYLKFNIKSISFTVLFKYHSVNSKYSVKINNNV